MTTSTARACLVCADVLDDKRRDAKTCSATCRSALRRQRTAETLREYRQLLAERDHN